MYIQLCNYGEIQSVPKLTQTVYNRNQDYQLILVLEVMIWAGWVKVFVSFLNLVIFLQKFSVFIREVRKVAVLNESQQEKLKEITAYLRCIRQEKSIRLEEIAMQTHIRLALLQALEEWRFEDLPEPVFVQGFIRRYADKLGLDGIALANSFEINLFTGKPNNSTAKSSLYIPLFVPYIFLIIAASGGLFYLLQSEFTGKSLANKQNPILSVQQKTVPSPVNQVISTPAPSPINTPISSPSSSPKNTPISKSEVAVTLELKGNSWIQIKADGKTEFEGTLSKGERKTWTAKNSLTVRYGNAGAVLVSVNDEEPKILGNVGEVKEITYNSQESGVRRKSITTDN